jgi:hypothetical protein
MARVAISSGFGARRRATLPLALAAALIIVTVAVPCVADDASNVDEGFHAIALPGETWVGAEGFGKVWSLYSGGNYAPFGALTDTGVRLRAVAGTSGYRYTSPRWTGTKTEAVPFQGQSTFIDALAGYQTRYGQLTAKIFLGATYAHHRTATPNAAYGLATGSAIDNETRLNGQHFGGKGAVELWLNLGEYFWTSLDVSMTTLNVAYTAHNRLGWRATSELSIGVEAGTVGFTDHDTFHETNVRRQFSKLGVFARYDAASSEVIISGGLAQSRGDLVTPYATAQYLTRF